MTVITELGHVLMYRKLQAPTANRNAFLENLQSAVEARNNQIASALSLAHNEPDDKGRTRVQQEKDRLRRTSREQWKRTNNPMAVGDNVLIPPGTPVGIGSDLASYIAEIPLRGTLISVSGGYGGDGYLETSQEIIEPLFKVNVIPERHEPTKAVTLLVPNDLLTQAIQA